MVTVLARLGRCVPSRWRQRLKRELLLCRPSLYAADFIRYEQSLAPDESEMLLARLEETLALPGDVIECGCFLCGTTVHLARHLEARQAAKRLYGCDTFAGFDPAEFAGARVAGGAAAVRDFSDNDWRYVQRKLRRLGVADRVTLVRGLFQETLETLPGPFCFAFIDCDLHDSLLYAARTVWPRLSPGGGCVFDDYDNDEYRAATQAVEAFLAEHRDSIATHGRLGRKMYFAVKRQ